MMKLRRSNLLCEWRAAEFGRLALALLGVCDLILDQQARVPMRDLPVIMAMPEAVVYKATADRISRLPYGAG